MWHMFLNCTSKFTVSPFELYNKYFSDKYMCRHMYIKTKIGRNECYCQEDVSTKK